MIWYYTNCKAMEKRKINLEKTVFKEYLSGK